MRIIHSKVWLIDDDVTYIGSHNLTLRSLKINNETSTCIYDQRTNQILTDHFLKIFSGSTIDEV